MGTASLVQELRQAGIEVVTEADDRATVVLLGFDTENTSRKSAIPVSCWERMWRILATNPDLVCPVSFGYIPDCIHDYHVKKCHRERAIFYWKTRADYGKLCIEETKQTS